MLGNRPDQADQEDRTLPPDEPPRIGPFRTVRLLGKGGMGAVYLGEDTQGRQAAVKIILPELVASERDFIARFKREIAMAGRVSNRYLPEVLAADPEDNPPWLATTYVPDHHSLADQVGPRRTLSESDVNDLVLGVASALSAMHRENLVHRDIKPANILYGDDGPYVVDFGIARPVSGETLTRTGAPVSTPRYAAPEQASGRFSPAVDIWALGLVAFEAATGRWPFDGATHDANNPDLARCPAYLRSLVSACLQPEPGHRPTADDILAAAGDWAALPAVMSSIGAHASAHSRGPIPRGAAYLIPTRPATDPGPHGDPGSEPKRHRGRVAAIVAGITVVTLLASDLFGAFHGPSDSNGSYAIATATAIAKVFGGDADDHASRDTTSGPGQRSASSSASATAQASPSQTTGSGRHGAGTAASGGGRSTGGTPSTSKSSSTKQSAAPTLPVAPAAPAPTTRCWPGSGGWQSNVGVSGMQALARWCQTGTSSITIRFRLSGPSSSVKIWAGVVDWTNPSHPTVWPAQGSTCAEGVPTNNQTVSAPGGPWQRSVPTSKLVTGHQYKIRFAVLSASKKCATVTEGSYWPKRPTTQPFSYPAK